LNPDREALRSYRKIDINEGFYFLGGLILSIMALTLSKVDALQIVSSKLLENLRNKFDF